MEMNERIKELGSFFKGMRVIENDGKPIIYVEIQYPKGWLVDDEINTKYGVVANNGGEYVGQIFFGADIDTGFDTLFNCIEENIKKMKDMEKRGKIFKAKTDELKALYETRLKEMQAIFMDESKTLEELEAVDVSLASYNTLPLIPKEKPKEEVNESFQEVENDSKKNKDKKKEVNE